MHFYACNCLGEDCNSTEPHARCVCQDISLAHVRHTGAGDLLHSYGFCEIMAEVFILDCFS